MHTVLVVDDETVICKGLSRILSSDGYRVLVAHDGREALQIMGAGEVHAVLCDLKMPGMGAIGVLDEAGAKFPGVPVIIITGQGTEANAAECMQKGAFDFVTKPFRNDQVLALVKRAIEKRRPSA